MLKKPWFARIFSKFLQPPHDRSSGRALMKAPETQNNLAIMYAASEGVDRDQAQATKWFARSAAKGDAAAQFPNADTCRERVNLQMSREAVAEGNRRVSSFVATPKVAVN
jgi:hypothetical protein